MQQAEETTAEAEAEGDGVFLRIAHRGVVQLQLFQRVTQIAVFRAVRRIHAGEDHRLRLLIARQGLGTRPLDRRDRVADARVGDSLDRGRQIADLARAQLLGGRHAERVQIADLDDLIDRAGRHEADVHAGADGAVHDAHVDDGAAVGIVLAVEDQALQRRVPVALRRGHVADDHLEHGMDVDAVFRRDLRRVERRNADDVLDLVFDLLGPRSGQIDLVDDRQDLQPRVDGKIRVRERLRLDALRRIHHEDRALAGRQAAGYFVVEVHMARRVDEVQHILLPVVRRIVEAHGAGLDGDAALALEVHVVEHLILHLALVDRAALLEQPVGQRGLAVVNVRHNGKIANFR